MGEGEEWLVNMGVYEGIMFMGRLTRKARRNTTFLELSERVLRVLKDNKNVMVLNGLNGR